MQETLNSEATVPSRTFYRLSALEAIGRAPGLPENVLIANYRGLNKTQSMAANFLLCNLAGVSWSAARERADETTWRSLEKKGLAFFLPTGKAPQKVAISLEHRFMLDYRSPSSFSLLEALADYRLEVIQMMAAQWCVDTGPLWLMRASIFAAAQAGLAQTLASLSMQENEILEDVIDDGPEGSTRKDLGLFQENWRFWAQKQDFMRSPPAGEKPLQSLILKGLVVFKDRRLASEADPGSQTLLYAVSEVGPLLKALSNAPAQPVTIIAQAPSQALCHADSFLRDLARVMCASLSSPVELTRAWQMSKTSLKRLATHLGMEDIPRLEWLLAFLHNQEFMTSQEAHVLLPGKEVRHALEKVAKGYADVTLTWRTNLAEKHRSSLRHIRHRYTEPNLLRVELVQRLIALPEGAWASAARLAEALGADKIFVQRLERNRWYLGQTYRERVMRLRSCVVDELRLLFDCGAIEADAGLTTVRPSPLLQFLANGQAPSLPPEVAEDGMGLIVQPNLEALAPLWLPLADQFVLAASGMLKSIEHMATYAFSLESLYKGANKGVGIAAVRATLARHCKAPLPRAFEALLLEFEIRAGEIVLMPAPILIRLRQPQLGKIIARLVDATPLDGAPGYYYVPKSDPKSLENLLRTLRRKGHFPSVDDSLMPEPEEYSQ